MFSEKRFIKNELQKSIFATQKLLMVAEVVNKTLNKIEEIKNR